MMTNKTIEAKFRRADISSKKTCLWLDMPENLKNEIQNQIQSFDSELPIICFYKSIEYILLLTTQRLIVITNNAVEYYLYSSIIDVRLDEIFKEKQSKKENNIINIILKSGKQIDIIVEPETWHVLYGIIKQLSFQSNIVVS
jgi:hypothetical protein